MAHPCQSVHSPPPAERPSWKYWNGAAWESTSGLCTDSGPLHLRSNALLNGHAARADSQQRWSDSRSSGRAGSGGMGVVWRTKDRRMLLSTFETLHASRSSRVGGCSPRKVHEALSPSWAQFPDAANHGTSRVHVTAEPTPRRGVEMFNWSRVLLLQPAVRDRCSSHPSSCDLHRTPGRESLGIQRRGRCQGGWSRGRP